MEQYNNFINEDQIILSETVLDLRRELNISIYSKKGNEDTNVNETARAFIEIV